MLNTVILQGRMAKDPELREVAPGQAVTTFSIAVERDFKSKDQTRGVDFFDVVAWRNTAEFIDKYFHKGDMIILTGHLQVRTWEDKNQNKRRNIEVIADKVFFGGRKADSSKATEKAPESDDGFLMVPDNLDDMGLPFN